MRAGSALREKWAMEAAWNRSEERWPGYHARHWRSGELRSQVIKRYADLLLTRMGAEDAFPLLAKATERVRVVERDGQFILTAAAKAAPTREAK